MRWSLERGRLIMGTSFGVNGRLFNESEVAVRMQLGAVQEWTVGFDLSIIGVAAGLAHPFHLHTNTFQIVGIPAALQKLSALGHEGDWRDTLDTPLDGTFRMRFTASDFRGKMPFHCHEAQHSDYGMMANAVVE